MRKPRLTRDERRVLDAALAAYHESAVWPQFGALHPRLAAALEGELGDVATSLIRKLGGTRPLSPFGWTDEIQIPARGILLGPRIEETYAVLMRALPLLRDFYLATTEKPHVTHQFFLDRGWAQVDVWRLYELLRYQRFHGGMGATPTAGTWNMDLTPEIIRYAKAGSARELWTFWISDEKKWNKQARARPKGLLDYGSSPSRERWIERYLVPFLVAVMATVVAGAILWRLRLT